MRQSSRDDAGLHGITGLELGLAINEIKDRVIGGYVKRFYDLGGGSFRISMHSQAGNMMLYCKLLCTLNETRFAEEAGAATGFAKAVRNRIEGSRILDLRQQGSDRIAVIEMQGKEGRRLLIIEMFGKGNVAVVDEAGKVEVSYLQAAYRDRSVKPGSLYIYPKSDAQGLDSLDNGRIAELADSVAASEEKAIAALGRRLNIGPIYLEDIITSAGADPRKRLAMEDRRRFEEALARFVEKARHPEPVLYLREGKVVEYAVFGLAKMEGIEFERCASVNEMLDKAYVKDRSEAGDDGSGAADEEMRSVVSKQEGLASAAEEESARLAEAGRRIFGRMNEINALIIRIREAKKPSLDELRSEFPELGVKHISLKDRKVRIEV